jgi:pyridoxine 4-dehydrogenase
MRITAPASGVRPLTGQTLSGLSSASASLRSISSTPRLLGARISERLIHEALYPHDGILIATKAGLTRPGPGEWQRDGRPDRLRQQAIKSDRLGLEQIGLWQLHSIDPKRTAR